MRLLDKKIGEPLREIFLPGTSEAHQASEQRVGQAWEGNPNQNVRAPLEQAWTCNDHPNSLNESQVGASQE